MGRSFFLRLYLSVYCIRSFLNAAGEVEMDAIIATEDMKVGAVASVQCVKNPIALARCVRDRTKNVLVVGVGASLLADECGLERCKTEDLLVGRERERHEELKKNPSYFEKTAFGDGGVNISTVQAKKGERRKGHTNGMGTVGVVARDRQGVLAVGVSTGGTPKKKVGRVGDSPLWGSGAYVRKGEGVAATGYGEDLIRMLICREAADCIQGERMKSVMEDVLENKGIEAKITSRDRAGKGSQGQKEVGEVELHGARDGHAMAIGSSDENTCQRGVEEAISKLSEMGGLGGLIALSSEGVGLAYNTPRMARAVKIVDRKGQVVCYAAV